MCSPPCSHSTVPFVPLHEAHLREAGPYAIPCVHDSLRGDRLPGRLRFAQSGRSADSELLLAALVAGPGDDGPVCVAVRVRILHVSDTR